MLARPECPAAEKNSNGRNQERPHDEGIQQHADGCDDAEVNEHLDRQARENRERPGQYNAG
ncbi:hypothetical protein D3C81_1794600 [compost metagenome]